MSVLDKSGVGIRERSIEGLYSLALECKRHADYQALSNPICVTWQSVGNPQIKFPISIKAEFVVRLTTKGLREKSDTYESVNYVEMRYIYGDTTVEDIKKFLFKFIRDKYEQGPLPLCDSLFDIVIKNYNYKEKDYVNPDEI